MFTLTTSTLKLLLCRPVSLDYTIPDSFVIAETFNFVQGQGRRAVTRRPLTRPLATLSLREKANFIPSPSGGGIGRGRYATQGIAMTDAEIAQKWTFHEMAKFLPASCIIAPFNSRRSKIAETSPTVNPLFLMTSSIWSGEPASRV